MCEGADAPSPNLFDGIGTDATVSSDERKALRHTLSDQQTVKRVPVEEWQRFYSGDMPESDGKNLEPIVLGLIRNEVLNWLLQ